MPDDSKIPESLHSIEALTDVVDVMPRGIANLCEVQVTKLCR